MPRIQTVERNELLGTYWIRFDLLADNTPPGRMASTSFPCAKRLLFLLVTQNLTRATMLATTTR
jgi:hypothetical protein